MYYGYYGCFRYSCYMRVELRVDRSPLAELGLRNANTWLAVPVP